MVAKTRAPASVVKMLRPVFPRLTSATDTAKESPRERPIDQATILSQRERFPAAKFCPTKVMAAWENALMMK